MQHAGDRAARAGPDVGRGAGDGAGDAHAAEGHRRHVGGTLGDELAVGAVLAPAHAVGDDRRQQALDGAEQGDGDGIGKYGAQLGEIEWRQRRSRQRARHLAEPASRWSRRRAGTSMQAPPLRRRRSSKPGHLGRTRRSPTMIATARADSGDGCRLERAEARPDGLQLGQQRRRLVRHVETEQLLQLAGENDDGDAGREADGDGEGDVLDVRAETQEPRGHHHQRRPSGWRARGRRSPGARRSRR